MLEMLDANTGKKLNKIDVCIYAIELSYGNAYDTATPMVTCRLSNLTGRLNDRWCITNENNE